MQNRASSNNKEDYVDPDLLFQYYEYKCYNMMNIFTVVLYTTYFFPLKFK